MKSETVRNLLIAAATALILLIGIAISVPVMAKAEVKPATQADEPKIANIYILAGQSNAVGHGPLSQTVKNQNDPKYTYGDMIKADDERNETGYENVYYYGTHDLGAMSPVPQLSITDIKIGLGGGSPEKIGPELGMAKALVENATEDSPAFVFRYASGGTAIGDHLCKQGMYGNLNYIYGGWASPTIKARWEAEERQNIASSSDYMYKTLLTVIERGIAEVEKLGYEPVLKGYAWMQGESDSDATTPRGQTPLVQQYEQNLTDFINDIRKDVAALFDNEDAGNAPFVIGKISPDYDYGSPDTKRNNGTIRKIQDKVANTLKYCYTVETDDLLIFDYKNKVQVGADVAHFNAGDQYTLGQRFATAIDAANTHAFTVTAGEGGTAPRNVATEGNKLTFKIKPDEGKVLSKVLINGEEVTGFTVKDDTVTVTLGSGIGKYNELEVQFKQASQPEKPHEPKSKFPVWAIIIIIVAVLGGAGAAVAVVLTGKKRKAQKA